MFAQKVTQKATQVVAALAVAGAVGRGSRGQRSARLGVGGR